MVSAWPEPPNAKSAATSAGVRNGVKAFASTTTETLPNRAGEEQSGVQAALNESFERAFLRSIGLCMAQGAPASASHRRTGSDLAFFRPDTCSGDGRVSVGR
jgi:hypothetical protein